MEDIHVFCRFNKTAYQEEEVHKNGGVHPKEKVLDSEECKMNDIELETLDVKDVLH